MSDRTIEIRESKIENPNVLIEHQKSMPRWRFPLVAGLMVFAEVRGEPLVMTDGRIPNDRRLQPLKDLDGYFPFTPPASREQWEQRAAIVRRS